MSKQTLEYTEKHHILEVDGVEYEIPQRTAGLEKKLIERNENIRSMTEYERNISFLSILFGEEAVNNMFPDGDETNLDKLEECVIIAEAAYMAEHNRRENEKLKEKMKDVKPVLSAFDQASKAVAKTNMKKFVGAKK